MIKTESAFKHINVYFEGSPEYDYLKTVEDYLKDHLSTIGENGKPLNQWWAYKYLMFGAGVIWGKRLERARRKGRQ